MTNDDMTNLGDELRDLAGGAAPVSTAAARDRARRGIARHQRNRRAAFTGTAAVVIVVATVTFAVGRDHDNARPPVGTIEPTTAHTTAPSTSIAPTTTNAPTTTTSAPKGPFTLTVPPDLSAAPTSYSSVFPWGTGPGEVAFHTPQGEGASGGPSAFSADHLGNIVMLDHSNSRIVSDPEDESAFSRPIALASPAVTAAAFDADGRVIVATVADLAVFGRDGKAEGAWAGMAKAGEGIYKLEIDGDRVYSVESSADGPGPTLRRLVLRDTGSGYEAVRDATPEPMAITISVEQNLLTLKVASTGVEYRIATGFTDVRAVSLRADGTLVFVGGIQQSEDNGNLDLPLTYVIGRIDRSGHGEFAKITSSTGYTMGGMQARVTEDGVAVMGSTTNAGVTISYYRI